VLHSVVFETQSRVYSDKRGGASPSAVAQCVVGRLARSVVQGCMPRSICTHINNSTMLAEAFSNFSCCSCCWSVLVLHSRAVSSPTFKGRLSVTFEQLLLWCLTTDQQTHLGDALEWWTIEWTILHRRIIQSHAAHRPREVVCSSLTVCYASATSFRHDKTKHEPCIVSVSGDTSTFGVPIVYTVATFNMSFPFPLVHAKL